MATTQRYDADGLREQWDSATGYTAWDISGKVTTQRALTTQEAAALAAADAQRALDANGQALRDRAAQALAANATFLAIASPTNVQVVAQVKALTKECNALIRLLLGNLDDVTGT